MLGKLLVTEIKTIIYTHKYKSNSFQNNGL